MKTLNSLNATVMLGLLACFTVLPTVVSAHSLQAKGLNYPTTPYPHLKLPPLYSNVSDRDMTFSTANTPMPIVSVPYVKPGFYEVTFAGSVQFSQLTKGSSGTVTCYITVDGIKQSAGKTIVREGTGFEGINEIIPFAVTDVVYVPLGKTVSGVCEDTTPNLPPSGTSVLSHAQITLVEGRAADYYQFPFTRNLVQGQNLKDHLLYRNVSTRDMTFATANTPMPIVSVPHVDYGNHEVTFAGSVQFPSSVSGLADTVTCYITVNGVRQSSGRTIVRENTGGAFGEEAVNDVIPFAVTDVVYVPRYGGTVAGTCEDTTPNLLGGTSVLAGAQITLIKDGLSNVSDRDMTFNTANTPMPIVSVPNVRHESGFYEVTFAGSVQFPQIISDMIACYITVNGIRQSPGQTIIKENVSTGGKELAENDATPFAVTDVVYVPRGGIVSGVCEDNTSNVTPGIIVLAGAQITLVPGEYKPFHEVNAYTPGYYARSTKHIIKY